jgi:uncharacterized protein
MQRILKTIKLSKADLTMDDAETGKFSGYASVFGGMDSYGDTIMPGAFAETLTKNGMPRMFFNHEWDMPIGKYTFAQEDQVGLKVSGEYTPDLGLAQDVYAAMKHGTIDGLSIGGYLASGDYEETEQGRIIHRWTNLVEVSPVVFPADSSARIGDVKSINFEALLTECKTERDIERLLRDAGLGKWEAMATVSRVKAIIDGRDAQNEADMKALNVVLERIKRISE